MNKLRVLDLFSGIGGFSLGLERTGGFETVAFCEIEEFPRKVLKRHWPKVPCFPDVRALKGTDIDGPIDVICGGYPCQPFSTAGQRRGKEDDRHLWPEFSRLVDELRPTWVIGENVAGHISMGLDDVLSDLEGQGYACRAFVIPACAVDAPHRRNRVWIVAYSKRERSNVGTASRDGKETAPNQKRNSEKRSVELGSTRNGDDVAHASQLQRNGCGEYREQGERQISESGKPSGAEFVAHANDARLQGGPETGNAGGIGAGCDELTQRRTDVPGAAWSLKPDVGRMVDGVSRWVDEPRDTARVALGVPNRVQKLKTLGNAVVPQIPEMIGHAILHAEAAA